MEKGGRQKNVTGDLITSADNTHLFRRPRTSGYLFLVCTHHQSEYWFIRQCYPPSVLTDEQLRRRKSWRRARGCAVIDYSWQDRIKTGKLMSPQRQSWSIPIKRDHLSLKVGGKETSASILQVLPSECFTRETPNASASIIKKK